MIRMFMSKEPISLLTIRRKHLLPEISRNRLRMSNRPMYPDRNSKSFVLKISAFAYGMVAANNRNPL
jgi:hypothetical protein